MRWLKRMFTRRRAEQELEDELRAWRVVSLENALERKFAVIRLRILRPPNADDRFTTAVRVRWNYDAELPPTDINERQIGFETAIDELTGDNGFSELVQVATGRGAKEWLFYTSGKGQLMAEFNRLLESHDRFPVEISVVEDPDWTIWRESVEAVRQKTA